jgi:hypothetical protein
MSILAKQANTRVMLAMAQMPKDTMRTAQDGGCDCIARAAELKGLNANGVAGFRLVFVLMLSLPPGPTPDVPCTAMRNARPC